MNALYHFLPEHLHQRPHIRIIVSLLRIHLKVQRLILSDPDLLRQSLQIICPSPPGVDVHVDAIIGRDGRWTMCIDLLLGCKGASCDVEHLDTKSDRVVVQSGRCDNTVEVDGQHVPFWSGLQPAGLGVRGHGNILRDHVRAKIATLSSAEFELVYEEAWKDHLDQKLTRMLFGEVYC